MRSGVFTGERPPELGLPVTGLLALLPAAEQLRAKHRVELQGLRQLARQLEALEVGNLRVDPPGQVVADRLATRASGDLWEQTEHPPGEDVGLERPSRLLPGEHRSEGVADHLVGERELDIRANPHPLGQLPREPAREPLVGHHDPFGRERRGQRPVENLDQRIEQRLEPIARVEVEPRHFPPSPRPRAYPMPRPPVSV